MSLVNVISFAPIGSAAASGDLPLNNAAAASSTFRDQRIVRSGDSDFVRIWLYLRTWSLLSPAVACREGATELLSGNHLSILHVDDRHLALAHAHDINLAAVTREQRERRVLSRMDPCDQLSRGGIDDGHVLRAVVRNCSPAA